MCRWIGYIGSPLKMAELIVKPPNSLVYQSRASREGAEAVNGDGFGLGWYNNDLDPGTYRNTGPAWNDQNLASLSEHIRSHLFLAHVRATTGTPIQQSNCHPFLHGQWLFVHNGLISRYHLLKRDLTLEVAPALYPHILGTTDSELMFFLALTFGLEHEPILALERMAGFVELKAEEYDINFPLQMTLGLSDGERLYAVRYSSEGNSRSLYHSESMEVLYDINPELKEYFTPDARAIVSEPLGENLHDEWIKVPEAKALIIERGEVLMQDFVPKR